jgi:(p)ppGpp synthase/HD superfamily hydrolase
MTIPTVADAVALAAEKHHDAVDKGGAPYILHPLRMMLRMSNPTEMMAAVLHDVVEDGPGWTVDRLKEEGIPPEVVAAVSSLTKLKEEEDDYDSFIRRAASNPVARRVKLADLEDNMDLGRISNPTEKDYARIEKYRSAYAFLRSLAVDDQFDQPIEAGS